MKLRAETFYADMYVLHGSVGFRLRVSGCKVQFISLLPFRFLPGFGFLDFAKLPPKLCSLSKESWSRMFLNVILIRFWLGLEGITYSSCTSAAFIAS